MTGSTTRVSLPDAAELRSLGEWGQHLAEETDGGAIGWYMWLYNMIRAHDCVGPRYSNGRRMRRGQWSEMTPCWLEASEVGRWLEKDGFRVVHVAPAAQSSISSAHEVARSGPVAMPKAEAQEQALLNAIRKLGLDPERLPNETKGKPGSRKRVRDALAIPSKIFVSEKAFDHAWERALRNGVITRGGALLR